MKASRFLQTAAAVSVVIFATTAFPVTAQANEFYQVTNVQSDDSLNIRSGAGTQHSIIGSIPANGRTILTTGNSEQVGSSTWVEVVWLGQIGWVNSSFLAQGNVNLAQDNSQSVTSYQQQAPVANSNSHTHPANRCTRSISHTHPNGARDHSHRYSCQPNQMQPQQQVRVPKPAGNVHTHPANRCTRSISHTHPNGTRDHSHRYSCQPNQSQPQQQVQAAGNAHTHPANRCTRSISHTHPNGARDHSHRYSCQPNQSRPQQQVQAAGNAHTHPANRCTRSISHTHPNGSGTHQHRYACNAQQMANPKAMPKYSY